MYGFKSSVIWPRPCPATSSLPAPSIAFQSGVIKSFSPSNSGSSLCHIFFPPTSSLLSLA